MHGTWLWDVARLAIFLQKSNRVVVPDLLWGWLIWGHRGEPDAWPANWRRLVKTCFFASQASRPGEENLSRAEKARRTRVANAANAELKSRRCPESCPLHGRTRLPHLHFRWKIAENQLGGMTQFITNRADDGWLTFDFRNPKWTREEVLVRRQELRSEIKEADDSLPADEDRYPEIYEQGMAVLRRLKAEYQSLRPGAHKVEGVRAVYMPIRIFGPSPRAGQTAAQCNVIKALTMELTRSRRANDRPDKAQVVNVGSAGGNAGGWAVSVPGDLEPGAYVAFGGTGRRKRERLHGHGFRIGTWMAKAGYGDLSEYRVILRDLQVLSRPFGLAVRGYNSRTQEWRSLEDLLALCRTKTGKAWLQKCVLRVYTRADYLARWRRYFAERLGFSSVPGGGEEPSQAPAPAEGQGTMIQSADELRAWMRREGLTDTELAKRMGVHRVTVNHYRTGRRLWSESFAYRVNGCLFWGVTPSL